MSHRVVVGPAVYQGRRRGSETPPQGAYIAVVPKGLCSGPGESRWTMYVERPGAGEQHLRYEVLINSSLSISPPLITETSYSDLISGENKVALPLSYELFQQTVQMRGLRFVLGWQTDRLIELPFKVSCVWFGISAIWLGLVLWGWGGGDWGIGFAFAQVVAASISIVITLAQQ